MVSVRVWVAAIAVVIAVPAIPSSVDSAQPGPGVTAAAEAPVVAADFERRLGIPPLTGFGAHRQFRGHSSRGLHSPRAHGFHGHGHRAHKHKLFKSFEPKGFTVIIRPHGFAVGKRGHGPRSGKSFFFRNHHRHGFGTHKFHGFGGHHDRGFGLRRKGPLW